MPETTHAVRQIPDAEFEGLISAGKPVFIDFWAPWRGPCRIIGPLDEELAPSYNGKAEITKMNVDENPMVAQKFGVTSIPTRMMFKNANRVNHAVRAVPRA